MRRKLTVKVASQQKAETADAVVCMLAPKRRPPLLADNVFGICSDCGRRVQHRPHIPKAPKLLCIECCPPDPRHENMITPATLQEWLKKISH